MAVKDKEKRIQQAEKFVLQGKIANAITEYQRIAEDSPSDILLFNTIGDLYVLSGNPRQATPYFLKVVEAYIKGGFVPKAIAMQKKVVSLDQQNLEALAKLGELYIKKGLSAEARQQYLIVARALENKGQEREAVEHYRKAIDLGPEDTQTELRLAELYAKQKNPEQAKIFYARAGAHLIAAKHIEESRKALNKALEINPAYPPALKGCLRIAHETGQYTEVLHRIETANNTHPNETDLVELLGEVYLLAGRRDDAEPCFHKLITLDDNRYEHLFTLAEYYLNQNDLDRSLKQIQTVTAILLSRRESDRIVSFLKGILEVNPAHLAALGHLADVYNKINNKKEAVSLFAKMVDLYMGEENYPTAIKMIEQIAEIDPTNYKFVKMHREIFAEAFPGQPYISPWRAPADEPEKTPAEVVSESLTAPRKDKPTPAADDGMEINLDTAVEIDLSEDLRDIFAPQPPVKQREKAPERVERKVPNVSLDWSSAEETATPGTPDTASLEMGLQEVDFYIRLGFFSEGQNRLVELARSFPDHPEIIRLNEVLKEEAKNSSVNLPEVEWPKPEAERRPSPETGGRRDAIDKKATIDNNTPAAELSLNLGDLELPPEERESSPKYSIRHLKGIRPEEGTTGQEKPKPFTEIVEDIKNYIGTDKEGDFQTQFDLGVAYKEMGLLDEAIGQFQAAYRVAKEAADPGRSGRCCTLLGGCFQEKGMPTAAVRWCKMGLSNSGLSEDEIIALKYELAGAQEKCGETREALDLLNEIYEMNINYRDVTQRISQLGSKVKAK